MNRRKFISLGGIISATTVVGVTSASGSTEPRNDLPRFKDGQLLSSASLNAMIDRINDLERRANERA